MFELALRAQQALVEPVSDVLMDELDALSVSVEDADAGSAAEQALFDNEPAAEKAATLLLAQDWTAGLHVQGLQRIDEQDWVRLTQSQFAPVQITPDFWVVPSWHEPPAGARLVIRLDPGLAFGTGTHPTTQMCLRWLATQPDVHRQRVLDYGCGSGILAIGAALTGWSEVDAVDIDPAAVQSTQLNASANGVHVNSGLPDMAQGDYTLVLANILATPLKLLAPLLAGHVAPGGSLVLAGILDRQAGELAAAYAPTGLALAVADSQDGWILMTARRASGGP